MKQQIVIIFVFAVLSAAQKPLPKYIEPCKRNDSKLNECFAKSANRAIEQMVKGDAEYGIPLTMPFKYPKIDFNIPGLKLSLNDITIYGLENMKVVDPQIDLEKKIINFNFDSPLVMWEGDYIAEVRTPLGVDNKKGHVNIHFVNGNFLMHFQFALENRNGTDYAKIILTKEEVPTVDIRIEHNNEANGLNDEEWNLFKDNIIDDDVLLVCAKAIASFIQAIFNVVPFDDVFP